MSTASNVNFKDTSITKDLDEFGVFLSQLSIREHVLKECLHDAFETSNAGMSGRRDSFAVHSFLRTMFIRFFHVISVAFKTGLSSLFMIGFIYLFVTSHNSVQNLIMRHSQNYIYPIMRSLRLWTLPVARKYEILSDWHEEECLVNNPLYHEPLLDCWPCEDVKTLVDLTGLNNYSNAYVYNEQPFIVRDSLGTLISLQDLQNLYKMYSIALDRGTAKFISSEREFYSLKDVLTKDISPDKKNTFQAAWKINRVAAARIVRKTFPRPYFVPNNSEVALERFLYLSGSEAPQFFLPLTDFANVWIAQGHGYRLIVLDPSEPCISNCSTVSVLLRPQDILYYNWQFWRPRSLPARLSEDISITYVGSFY